ncbi:hypothetical protein, partial [Helicobacter pylori]|uniref:hypothetical protein n=1 Tax=Helicobacter pylori TaxID=210 RepID=UPI001C62636E
FDSPRLKKRRCLQHGAMTPQELEKAESFFRFFHKMFLKVMFYCKMYQNENLFTMRLIIA